MKNIIFFKKNWLYFIPILLLGIFIYSIWDKNYYIGGDLMFPLKAQDSISKSIYLWMEENGGGSFFGYTLLLWQGFFYILSLFGLPSFLSIKIFIVLLYSLGFIFSYLTFKNLFKETPYGSRKNSLFAALMFFLNPSAILVLIGAIPLYAFPICFYFITKYLDRPRLITLLFFAFFINISFFTEGPQLKLAVTFAIAVVFLIFIYKSLRQISLGKILWRMLGLVFFTVCLNLFILLPFVNDAFGSKGFYHEYTRSVSVYEGNGDVPTASLPYTIRFFNSSLIENTSSLGKFLTNPVFSLWTFILWIILLAGTIFIRDKKNKQIVFWLLLPLLFFIFLAKGANPPFGEIYRYLIFHLPFFKIFRTTSTVIIGGVIFFSFLLSVVVFKISGRWRYFFYLILLLNIIIFHPVYLAYKLKNYAGNEFVQKGFSLPIEYLKMGEMLDNLGDDDKLLSLPQTDNYTSKNWYFGQSLLNWLTRKPFLFNLVNFRGKFESFSQEEACLFSSLYNLGYVVLEKDSTAKELTRNLAFAGDTLVDNKYLRLVKINDSCRLPHLYIPSQLVYYEGDLENFFPASVRNTANIAFYKTDISFVEQKQILEKSNTIAVEVLPSNANFDMRGRNYARLFLSKENFVGDIFYPYVRIKPDSFFYSFVLWKERRDEELIAFDKRSLYNKELFFASKRISELVKWGVNNQWWKENLRNYSQKMEKAIRLSGGFGSFEDNLELATEYLDRHNVRIRKLSEQMAFWNKEKITSWEKEFARLKLLASSLHTKPDLYNLKYLFDLPFAGQYNLLLDNDQSVVKEGKVSITINDQPVIKAESPNLGQFNLKEKDNKIGISIEGNENLLRPQQWKTSKNSYDLKVDSSQLQFENLAEGLFIPENMSLVYQDVAGWKPGDLYLLTINYDRLKLNSSLNFIIKERVSRYNTLKEAYLPQDSIIIRDHLDAGNQYQVLVKADRNSLGAAVYLYSTEGKIKVPGISLTKVYLPRLVLSRSLISGEVSAPLISYNKINPVKYQVKVENATQPFFLVFSENYDQGWKLSTQATHFKINNYANAWYIPGLGIKEFTIEYEPQKKFYLGIQLSLISLLALAIFSLIKKFLRRKNA